ncbi:hypothetical protein FRC07_006189 [Ceratobasidium sp. 392]|nr:hypothetical protein FRC07_006189 [Ceratobasidium sp. 392]
MINRALRHAALINYAEEATAVQGKGGAETKRRPWDAVPEEMVATLEPPAEYHDLATLQMSSKNNNQGSKPSVAVKRHSEFYMDNSLIVIQTEDTLFRVHEYLLRQSETYLDVFGRISEDPKWGTCPENPFVLEDVTVSDFECLLKMLYARQFTTHQLKPEPSLIIPAFRLARKWKFEGLVAYLLPLAEKELNDVEKVALAREFNNKEWLVIAHINLCLRTEPFTTDEAVKLGVHSLLLIYRLRD